MPPAVAIATLVHRYAGAAAPTLDLPALTIQAGEKVALIGLSGAGKSTLLKLIDGRLAGWTGSAAVLGRELSADKPPPRQHRSRTGFIFQEYALIETVSAFRNVMNGRLGAQPTGRSLLGRYGENDETIVRAALETVGMSSLARRRAERLSGGQRQRVAIARCLAQEPELILADEPIASLDPVNAAAALTMLRDVTDKRSATLIMSSHQPDLVADSMNRFIALDAGRIVYDGTPAEFGASEFAAVYGQAQAATEAPGGTPAGMAAP